MFIILYKSIVRPLLEYATCIWSPYLKKTSVDWNQSNEEQLNLSKIYRTDSVL